MYEYISGKLTELSPTYAVVEINGLGFFVNISLHTYSKLNGKHECKLYVHQAIREDAHILYGFEDKIERSVFRLLISVSGIGVNTARMMLSSLSPNELQKAIVENNVALLKSIKGIGAKSALRVIVDLRDKMSSVQQTDEIFGMESNTIKDEALSALIMLGFTKNAIEKVVGAIFSSNQNISVEGLVKESLKRL